MPSNADKARRSGALALLLLALLAAGCGGDSSRSVELWAVGDAADDTESADAVARMIRSSKPDLFAYLGDVYGSEDLAAFRELYDPLYGSLAKRTVPTAGNHEWSTSKEGYFAYWREKLGRRLPNYFARRAGSWEILSFNSNLTGRAFARQVAWARRHVRGGGNCRIAIWHSPRFSAGSHGDTRDLDPLWRAVQGKVRLVLNGHDHTMQRIRPVGGTTTLVSGAGGDSHYPIDDDYERLAFGDDRTSGALRLELSPGQAEFAFVGVRGRTLDSGRVECTG